MGRKLLRWACALLLAGSGASAPPMTAHGQDVDPGSPVAAEGVDVAGPQAVTVPEGEPVKIPAEASPVVEPPARDSGPAAGFEAGPPVSSVPAGSEDEPTTRGRRDPDDRWIEELPSEPSPFPRFTGPVEEPPAPSGLLPAAMPGASDVLDPLPPAVDALDGLGNVLARSLAIESGLAAPTPREPSDDRRSVLPDASTDLAASATADEPATPLPVPVKAPVIPIRPLTELAEFDEALLAESAGAVDPLEIPALDAPAPLELLVDAGTLDDLATRTAAAPDLATLPEAEDAASRGSPGSTTQAAAVPEPSTLSLFGVVVAVLLARRGRRA